MHYNRVLLKLSGEVFGNKENVISEEVLERISREIKLVHESKVEVAIVLGGGNIVRGKSFSGQDLSRGDADKMGMLATCINGLALKSVLNRLKVKARVMSSIEMNRICEFFDAERAVEYLQNEEVVIFVCGTSNPFFTTDTAAVLKAREVQADVVLKATKVDGIYDKDPKKFPDAVKYDSLEYKECLERRLEVMDLTALELAAEVKLEIRVFDVTKCGNIVEVVNNKSIGTTVS